MYQKERKIIFYPGIFVDISMMVVTDASGENDRKYLMES